MKDTHQSIPIVMTIAGSDPSCGAGLQADIKTFGAFEVYGLSAVTCITTQVPGNFASIEPVHPEQLSSQIDLLLSTYNVSAIKTGLLHSSQLIKAVLKSLDQSRHSVPLIVDPVMVSTSGFRLLTDDALKLYKEELIPKSSLFTPNLYEAATLLEKEPEQIEDLAVCAKHLYETFNTAVLLKGGHFKAENATDFLVNDSGATTFSEPFIRNVSTHGTGCAYSAAICSCIAKGLPLPKAIGLSKQYITKAIRQSLHFEGGTKALSHFVN